MAPWIVALCTVATAIGCSDDATVRPLGVAADSADGLSFSSDLMTFDAKGKDGGVQDAGVSDATPDLGSVIPLPSDFDQPCSKPTDCESGYCVSGPNGKVCTQTCVENCPPGWTCTQVGLGSDAAFICLPGALHICDPCVTSSDCNEEGSFDNACLVGPGGSFCGQTCSPDATPGGDSEGGCPAGYACEENTHPDTGKTTHQCVPKDGTCSCSPLAISKGLWTPCQVANAYGTCKGKRTCAAGGLQPCDAPEPAIEACNLVDDDCNGATDDLPAKGPCEKTNEFGTCTGSPPMCDGAKEVCDAPEPKPEDCNGLDDDCDGQTDEQLCDDGNPCTIDTCNTDGTCKNETPPDASCDDGNACTQQDKCAGGQCLGGDLKLCDDGNECTTDACDPAKGCVYQPSANGTACTDDGNPCSSDLCDGKGVCAHSTQSGFCTIDGQCVPAGATDPADPCKVCNPVQNKSAYVLQNGLSCDDGDACTIADKCQTGVCKGKPMDCSLKDGPCSTGVCQLGSCVAAPKIAKCDDGNACTTGDTCQDGVCAGTDKDCSNLDDPCHVGVCQNGACTTKAKTGACDDGDACTVNDSCASGNCVGKPMDCSGSSGSCVTGKCDGGQCVGQPANQGGACNDGNSCTTGDICQNGQCLGNPKDCSYLNDGCGTATCSAGQCVKANQGVCKPGESQTETQACGMCGKQTRTRTCSSGCAWGSWSAWSTCGGQGVCSPGKTESQSQGCGNCGSQTRSRSCSSSCQWNAWGSWGTCGGQGACAPGTVSLTCNDPCLGKVCGSNCQWGACGLKPGAVCAYKGGSNFKCCGSKKWQFCSKQQDGATPACNWYPCQYSSTAPCN